METKKTLPRRHHLLWILAGILIGIPMLAIMILSAVFRIHAIRTDQINTPSGMLKLKPSQSAACNATSSTTASLTQPTKPPKNFEDMVKPEQKKEMAALKKLWPTKTTPDPNIVFESFKKRHAGDPLSAEQKKWLLDHRDLIDTLMRLSAAGGYPAMTCEQAAALSFNELANMATPNFSDYMQYARLLAAEARRRIDSGDIAGSVEALMAVHSLAQSIREPSLIGELVSTGMQQISNHELAQWVTNNSISPDLANQLKGQLAAQITDLGRVRGVLELEYKVGRGQLLNALNGSLMDTMRFSMNNMMYWANQESAGDWSFWSEVYSDPLKTAQSTFDAAYMSAYLKSNAATLLDGYDDVFKKGFIYIETGQISDPYSLGHSFAPNFEEVRNRSCANTAYLELTMMAIDISSGNEPSDQTDPFINQPMKLVDAGDSMLIYSVGPDGKDDQGAVIYDPTNGLMSTGDICLKIKKKKK